MHSRADNYIAEQKKISAKTKNRKNALSVLSLFVVASVFWTLKLTGITMAGEAFCGVEEHTHSTECGQYQLICTVEETEAHNHSENCIAKQLACTEAEAEAHTHGESCYGSKLVCTLAEQPPHTHGDECKGVTAVCGIEEAAAHTHGEGCYSQTVACALEESEGHTHGDGCTERQMVCAEAEGENHTHADSCYKDVTVCTVAEGEGHTHSEGCMVQQLTCTAAETEGHTHGEGCMAETVVCTLAETEGHTHSEECYTTGLVCTLAETDGHIHGDECYIYGTGFGCSLTEAEGHTHTAECVTAETQLGCGTEATEGHTHTEECYQFTGGCTVEEHTHTENCYSNIKADLETSADWEATLPGLVQNARIADNLVAVAQSQIGYTESELNFEVGSDGVRRGYTRYGQWYGNPYGDWPSMFASFCLYYSGAEGIPLNSGAETMRAEWEAIGICVPAEDITPITGGIAFLDKNLNGSADAAAIITDVTDEGITVIEGDVDGAVVQHMYSHGDSVLMAYGFVPEGNMIMTLDERALSLVGKTYNYTGQNLSNNTFLVYTQSGGNYYAIDNNARAVPIYIDSAGNITADVADVNTIYWRFESANSVDNRPTYYIRNVAANNVYLHPYNNNSSNGAAIIAERWESVLRRENNGVRIYGARQNAYLQYWSNNTFNQVNNYYTGSVMYFASTPATYTMWLDGTDGTLRSIGGSPNTKYTVVEGSTINLPTEWQSPTKYEYKLRGWYDVTNSRYYAPGAAVTVTGNMVMYADWEPASYDVGVYNAQVADTVSTSKFITTRVFDYNALFNVQSCNPAVNVSADSHSETWSLVTNGNVRYNNQPTQDFLFTDMDNEGDLHYPNNRDSDNSFTDHVTTGIYSDRLAETLFNPDNVINPETGKGVIGKAYLGTGDHLFRYGTDPDSEYYGYYYYDSKLNAASYNKTAQRFYVYEYLEATIDTMNSSTGMYSDFLPLNSVYANTNGKNVVTYTYEGANGEYNGTTHYRFDAAYSDDNNSTNNVVANYSFGMSLEVNFYLPNRPGEMVEDGGYGNKDIYGKDMHFKFSGDDDVWVLIDGKLIMDIGGIHEVDEGDINFATGIVTVEGNQQRTLYDIEAGEHVLTIYYMDRGSSMSNCMMCFNLAPRYGLSIQKEDVLSQQLLDGAQFSVYTDSACTQPAQLHTSEEAYYEGEKPLNTFTVKDGTAEIWGFSSGNNYYIKETKPPDTAGYNLPKGIIRFSIDKYGTATYNIDMIRETDANGNVTAEISPGFTVHGIHIDEENQKAYISVTNAQNWVTDTTTVQTHKEWADDKDHSGDFVTVYLTVTDPDGTVRRIREMTLSQENDWTYTWTNLPKYREDGVTPVQYGVAESYEEGYYSTSVKVDKIVVDESTWEEALTFVNNEEYLLKTSYGCLATESAASGTLVWVDENVAKNSPRAQWHAMVSGGKVKFTNGNGWILNLRTTDGYVFNAVKENNSSTQAFTVTDSGGLKMYVSVQTSNGWWGGTTTTNYYVSTRNNNGTMAYTTSDGSALVFTPMILEINKTEINVDNWGYKITNTPLEEETALTVNKVWDCPSGDVTLYQENQVTIKLLANGVDTGRTVTLSLKNNWTDTFRGLPYKDGDGNVIKYTVAESWDTNNWYPRYGEITVNKGTIPTYSTTVTNTYIMGGPMLPSTGSFARIGYVLTGGGIMLASLVCGIRLRRRKERGTE